VKKIIVSVFAFILLLGLYTPSTHAAPTDGNFCAQYKGVKKIWWNGVELKSGQIGRLTVLKNTSLFKLNGDKKVLSRTLKAGEFFRIYAFKPGMLSVGGGYYVDRDTNVSYESPSKAKLLAVQCVNLPGWISTGGKWYYLNKDGIMATNTTVDGRKLGADGALIQVEYVALGDSLAAGMTPKGEDRVGDLGYPDYIKENFTKSYQLLDFDNFGVSGYTTDNVIADFNKVEVQKEIKEATHLTIDIGANDLLPVIQTNPAQAPTAIATIAAKLNIILSTIGQLNPKVKVYVMGYYNPFPYLTDVQKKAQLNQLLLSFNGQIQAQAILHGDTFVPTAQVINVANFADYIPNPLNIHLSPMGYQVVAEEFWKVIN
jgi:lysophospholipase L1-like esterase